MLKVRGVIILVCSILSTIITQAQVLIVDGEPLAYEVTLRGAMPEALAAMLRHRSISIAEGKPASSLLNRRLPQAASAKRIGPLLQMVRNQQAPFNLLCPYWTYDDGNISDSRCVSGCVATAIEQVMTYYRHPEALIDTLHGWSTNNYELPDLLPGTRFDWEHCLRDYRDGWTEVQGNAVALPTLAAGMAVKMHYGLSSSGSNLWLATEPLTRALDYGTTRCRDRGLYTPTHWHAMLRHELEAGRPIVYSAYTEGIEGHAFCLDGVDERGFYHISWGYGGNYDGWYDLEWLHPWEPRDNSEESGLKGFVTNHCALFMHPSPDADLLEPDTLRLDETGVMLDSIVFARQPDNQGYVPADFYFHHEGTDSVLYTFEVMTYLPTDTAIFEQADYVALASVALNPGEQRTERIYLHFNIDGQRLIGISNDDKTIAYQTPVSITASSAPILAWGTAQVTVSEDLAATCSITVANKATEGVAGNLVTFCLSTTDDDIDTRHYRVMNIPAGEQQVLTCTFTGLQPHTAYNLLVRCSWTVQTSTTFSTPEGTGIRGCEDRSGKNKEGRMKREESFDLSGRHATDAPYPHVIIRNGKKHLIR